MRHTTPRTPAAGVSTFAGHSQALARAGHGMGRWAACLALAALAGCATTLPSTVTETVQQRQVEYVLQGQGTPAVIFENGLAAKIHTWAKILPDVSRDTTTFAYNRPSYGASEDIQTPRDGEHVVNELRALLQAKGLRPPYILVGHSMGGLYMQYFARRYPQEVAGVVLVDSTHPAQFQGQGAPEKWPGLGRTGFNLLLSTTQKREFDLANTTGEEITHLPSFIGKPVVVLSALQPLAEKSALMDDANAKRADIARLFPGSKQVWVDSGHFIQWEKPKAVINAIRDVMAAGQRSTP